MRGLDELADRLVVAAELLHVRKIDSPAAYLGTAIAVSDMVKELDEALRSGGPLPRRWEPAQTQKRATLRAEAEGGSVALETGHAPEALWGGASSQQATRQAASQAA